MVVRRGSTVLRREYAGCGFIQTDFVASTGLDCITIRGGPLAIRKVFGGGGDFQFAVIFFHSMLIFFWSLDLDGQ